MKLHQEAVAAIIAKDPNIEGFMSSIGGERRQQYRPFLHAAQTARISANSRRTRLFRNCAPNLPRLPGVRTFLKNVPSIQIGGTSSKSQYQFTLQGQDTDELYRSADRF